MVIVRFPDDATRTDTTTARLSHREGRPPRVRHAEGHLLPLARDTPPRAIGETLSPLFSVRGIVTVIPRTRHVQGGA